MSLAALKGNFITKGQLPLHPYLILTHICLILGSFDLSALGFVIAALVKFIAPLRVS